MKKFSLFALLLTFLTPLTIQSSILDRPISISGSEFLESGVVAAGKGAKYTTRVLDEVADAGLIARVKELRGKLTTKFKKDGNFGYAQTDIQGLQKNEYYSHSAIQQFEGELQQRVPDISLRPSSKEFKTLEINPQQIVKGPDAYDRVVDTESKILHDISSRLKDRNVLGKN